MFLLSPYYQRDLRLKLQTLKQGDKGVEEYYHELLIGLALCGIREDDETSARFFGGLNRDIQDILDYKDWTYFSQVVADSEDDEGEAVDSVLQRQIFLAFLCSVY